MTTEAGTKLEGKSYVPYGLTRGADDISTAEYQFTDQERDGSTGLYNYDARLYDPVIGRFLSADSIVPTPFNPQAFNRYSYVINNPLVYTDPTGHWFRDPDTGENVPSDPSSYDVDSGGTPPEEHVDYRDGDDPGERGWDHSEKDGWTTIIKAPGSRVGRKIDAFGNTLNHVLLSNDEVLPKTEYERAQDEFARSILRPFNALSQSLGVRKKPGGLGKFKGRDALRRENNMARDAAREAGLSRAQRRELHDAISGQGISSYKEIKGIADQIKKGTY